MSKSVRRVRAALEAAGLPDGIVEVPAETRTARDAAAALSVTVDQIAKSVIFHAPETDRILLFVTAGGNRVDPARAAAVAGQVLGPADAALVRARTGFVIGGVAPLGHLEAPLAYFDPRLCDFDTVWAAAGTPRHVFPAKPSDLCRAIGAQESDFT